MNGCCHWRDDDGRVCGRRHRFQVRRPGRAVVISCKCGAAGFVYLDRAGELKFDGYIGPAEPKGAPNA